MKKLTTFHLIFLLGGISLMGQYSPKTDGSAQSLLLSETRIDRPVQMHKNQLQVNPGYGFHVTTGAFDNSGDKINYREQGLASSLHNFNLSVRYGVIEFLEFYAGLSYRSTLRRMNDLVILGNEFTEATSITEVKGMDDLHLGLSIRPVTRNGPFDLALRLGAIVPTASSVDEKPEHTVSQQPLYTKLDYHYLKRNGKGMGFMQAGIDIKYRLSSLALNLTADVFRGMGKSTYTEWNSQLLGSSFSYSSTNLPVKYADMYSGTAMIDVKVFSWFDVYGGFRYQLSNNGWKEISGIKYAIPETNSSVMLIGFEILTTTHLRILEHAELSLAGKNTDAQTGIFTSISYNLFTRK
jgi:hypothetical protein